MEHTFPYTFHELLDIVEESSQLSNKRYQRVSKWCSIFKKISILSNLKGLSSFYAETALLRALKKRDVNSKLIVTEI